MYYPRLKDLREDKDLTQKEVASFLGIDQRVYSNYETGKREIPTHFILALSTFYNTSTDYILGKTNNPTPIK
jgi:transcriptional regulator with XRE-family HTH domain